MQPDPAPARTQPIGQTAIAAHAERTLNPKALASLIFGVCNFVILPLISAIVAVYLGHVARRQIAEHPNQTGDGMALAGLILGYIGLVSMLLILLVFRMLSAAFRLA